MFPLSGGGFGFSSSKQFRGETGDVALDGPVFTAFSDGLSSVQILIIGAIVLGGLIVWRRA